jgi:hypothetical protein
MVAFPRACDSARPGRVSPLPRAIATLPTATIPAANRELEGDRAAAAASTASCCFAAAEKPAWRSTAHRGFGVLGLAA